MNFFEHQHAARRNSRRMVVLFVLAVIGVVVAMDAFIASLCVIFLADVPENGAYELLDLYFAVPAPVYVGGAGVTAALILFESLRQTFKLRAGGEAIATAFGARRVASGTTDPLERRLLNVVEEMAIAAGVRIPAVYVLDKEEGINAFAAGFGVSNSIVAVTRGTLEALNRDELQGVIGHEFSHILNGDCSLNMRMMGVLAGIVVVGSIGLFIIRSAFEADDLRGFVAILAVGVVVCIIGFTGLFFARLIKARVSREREFLADASSVQFTRNPDGIAGALDRIRTFERGTKIRHRYAEEVSHMFFGQSVDMWFSALFATHPPIEDRIRRIAPEFEPERYRIERGARAAEPDVAPVPEGVAGLSGASAPGAGNARAGEAARAWGRSSAESAALVGTFNAGKVDVARRLFASFPPGLRERLQSAEGAAGALVGLLLAPKDSVLAQQLDAVRDAGGAQLAEAAASVGREIAALGPALHLAVVDLALPALQTAPPQFRHAVLVAMEAAIHADRRVSLHEFATLALARSQLGERPAGPPKPARIGDVRAELGLVFSLLAHAGSASGAAGEREAGAAFAAGAAKLGLGSAQFARRDAIRLETFAAALERLRGLAPREKAILVQGLFATVTADRTICVMEAELMRTVGATLDCPLPPLLDELGPAAAAPARLADDGDPRRARSPASSADRFASNADTQS